MAIEPPNLSTPQPVKWLRVSDLIGHRKTGRPGRLPLKRTTFYALLARGDFPAPVFLSDRMPCWSEADVEAWEGHRRALSLAQQPSKNSGTGVKAEQA